MKNPFKKRKQIEEEDLKEITKREELINQHVLIVQSLQNELRGFLSSKMSKYGLDGQKDWQFDTKSGTIKEMKRPQQSMPMQAPQQTSAPTPPVPPVPPAKKEVSKATK